MSTTTDYRTETDRSLAEQDNTHFLLVGYGLWIFGFLGSHRFYYGRPITGTIWFFTLGLLLIGWLVDLVLMPSLQRSAEIRSIPGPYNHTIAWLLLTFLGVFGVHRFYLGKWLTGILYLATAGVVGLGVLYDFWTLNRQVNDVNQLST
jgi:TM2 domain-containing membrane protein YozV